MATLQLYISCKVVVKAIRDLKPMQLTNVDTIKCVSGVKLIILLHPYLITPYWHD